MGVMSMDIFDLKGKVVLITGFSRGLGFVLAKSFGDGDVGATVI